jgi:hypothetical protein
VKHNFAFAIVLAVVTSSTLAGCSKTVSEDWQAGFNFQSMISAETKPTFEEARNYCMNLYSETETSDYVDGCIAYVFDSSSSNANEDSSVVPVQPPPVTESIFSDLNSSGSTIWSEDKVANLSGIPSVADYLGSASDGTHCAVWKFEDEATAVEEAEGGSFDWVTGLSLIHI